MKRRRISALAVMMFLVCGLAACAHIGTYEKREAPETSISTEGVNLAGSRQTVGAKEAETMLTWAVWDIQTTNYWKALAEAYTEAHPDVKIEMVDLGSEDYSSVITTELSVSGAKFDVITIKDMPGYENLMAKSALEPLCRWVEKDGLDVSTYQGITDQLLAEGELYQMPFRSDFWLLFYNKDLFDELGVPYPENDMTIDEYDRLVRRVTRKEGQKRIYGAHYHTWRSTVQLFGILDGRHSILDGTYEFTKPYYEMVKQQEKDGVCRTYVDTNVSQLHYSAAFAAGNTATMNMGSWYINTLLSGLESGAYEKSRCQNWGIVHYPHPEGTKAGTTLGAITGLAISTASEQKDEAWEFIKFAASEKGAEIIARTGTIPAVMSEKVIEILTGLEGFPKDAASREALTTAKIYLEAPYDSRISEINTILDEYHKDIMDGSISIDAGIQKMNEEIAWKSKF